MDITTLSRIFGGFVRTVAKHPIASLFTTGLLTWGATIFFVITMFFQNYAETLGFIDKWFPSPVVENQRLQDSLPRDLRTCRAIDRLGISLNADRATFWAFSNGTLGTGGVPFNYSNVHCPYVSDGIAFIPEDMQKVPNAPSAEIHTVLFPAMETTGCGSWTIDNVRSPYLRANMRAVGTDIVFVCGVRDTNNVAIGKIAVSWRDRNSVKDPAEIITAIERTASAVGVINSLSVARENISKAIEKTGL